MPALVIVAIPFFGFAEFKLGATHSQVKPLGGTVGENYRVSPNDVGGGRSFQRLGVNRSIDGQVVEDT